MQRRGQNPFAGRDSAGNWSGARMSGQYNEQYRRVDILRWANFYGVPYQEPVKPVMDARHRTLYCVAAETHGMAGVYCRAMFNAL